MDSPTSTTPMLSPRGPLIGPTLLWRFGATMIASGMIAGAFGSHSLRQRPHMTEDKIHAWEAASSYAIYNGLALLLVSQHPRFSANKFAGSAIAIGGLVFSGTIMALVINRERFRFLGPVTPLSGSVMIAGYLALVL